MYLILLLQAWSAGLIGTSHHAELRTLETLLSSSPSVYQISGYFRLLQGYYEGGNVKLCLKLTLGLDALQ